jgi:antirestriction protein ArdC
MNTEKPSNEEQSQPSCLGDVSGSLRFSERDVDFAYLCGVFNVSGIDGLHKEIQRLKEIGKEPHNIIDACRKQ